MDNLPDLVPRLPDVLGVGGGDDGPVLGGYAGEVDGAVRRLVLGVDVDVPPVYHVEAAHCAFWFEISFLWSGESGNALVIWIDIKGFLVLGSLGHGKVLVEEAIALEEGFTKRVYDGQ